MATPANNAILPQQVQTTCVILTAQKLDYTNNSSVVVALSDAETVNGALINKITLINRAAVATPVQVQMYRRYPKNVNKVNQYYLCDMAMMPANPASDQTQAFVKGAFTMTPENPMIVGPEEEISLALGTPIPSGIVAIIEWVKY